MTLKVLPNDVRSMLSASAQINNYKTAVEELVYNSLDSESASIAIRVHIQENRIQVIDNGYGITKNDFDSLGQRHMTSKLTDLSTLKAIPKCYGYRGEFLANIIEISKNVKIISRYKDGEETWVKTFYEGKKKQVSKMTIRPSKGTTVEIKGFLYNLKIKKQGIDPVNELHNIKIFLEQLSLVHNNISISLRDDFRNEIIFKIHKKRDVYQTLSTLFGIEKNAVQELQIEKNQHKVKALIGKTDIEIGKHWIYLNGKFVYNKSKLHVIINEYLKKYLLITDKKKSKIKNNHIETHLFKSSIPFYFIFITCPYMDYDISSTLRKTVVEFKNWEQMKIMLEKLIKFYIGDFNLQEKKPEQQAIVQERNQVNKDTTRYKIRKIIDKILGSNSKKIGVSLPQNGVKGKRIKRKNKNKPKNVKNHMFEIIGAESVLNQNKPLQNSKDNKYLAANEKTCNNNKNNSSIHNIQHVLNTPKVNKMNSPIFTSNICVKTSNIKKNKKINHKKLKKYMSPEKICNKPYKNKTICKIKRNRSTKTKNNNQHSNVHQFPRKIDYVPIKSKVLRREVGEFLRYQDNCLKSKSRYNLLPNLNKYTIDNKMHEIKVKPFKTTYDLVQTVINSELDNRYSDNNRLGIHFRDYPVVNLMETSMKSPCKPRLPIDWSQNKKSEYNDMARNPVSYTLTFENTYFASSRVSRQYDTNDIYNYHSMPVESTQQSLLCENILRENSVFDTQKNSSSDLTFMPTVSALTYESHRYNHYNCNIFNNCMYTYKNMKNHINKTEKTRFITKQSKDNFLSTDKKYSYKHCFKTREVEKPFVKKSKHYSKYIKQTIDESYTIEFTKSNEITSSIKLDEQCDYRHVNEGTYTISDYYSPNYEPISGFGSTYNVPMYNDLSDCNKNITNQIECTITNEQFVSNSIHSQNMDEYICNIVNTTNNVYTQDKDSSKIVIISHPQNNDDVVNMDEDTIQPINLCETVFNENGSIEKEFTFSFNRNSRLDDSLYNNFSNDQPIIRNTNKNITQVIRHQNGNEDISHHFGNTGILSHVDEAHIANNLESTEVTNISNENDNIGGPSTHNSQNYVADCNKNKDQALYSFDDGNFNFKSRLRFLPKGMSQIFEKCGSKTVCDYNLDKDYYEDIIYNDFAKDVQMQTEIYEPVIQNVKDLTTKDIHNFKNKVQQDVTSLVFDQKSLKDAEVLNQVDCKFIAIIMKEKDREQDAMSEYLVLLDQHAVHERVRLEKNLADYFNEDQWKSVPIDNITLKMSNDEVIYMHNYKEKFNQLGIHWTLLNDEVIVSSIPEAILGKNPREVEKVMKAVKNLIVEEINVIKLQKGCISLYPKSVMDLVFSEACRYAIKFGDKLSKNDCIDLLSDLSNCKTPFQCAHGRPVMAVLVNIKRDKREYKINMASLRQFKLNRKTDAKNCT